MITNFDKNSVNERKLSNILLDIFSKLTNFEGKSPSTIEDMIKKHKNEIFCKDNEDCDVNMDNNFLKDDSKYGECTLPLNFLNKKVSENIIHKISQFKINNHYSRSVIKENTCVYELISDCLINLEQNFSNCLKNNGKLWETLEKRNQIVKIFLNFRFKH